MLIRKPRCIGAPFRDSRRRVKMGKKREKRLQASGANHVNLVPSYRLCLAPCAGLRPCQISMSLLSSSARLSAWSDEPTEFSQSSMRGGVSIPDSDAHDSLRVKYRSENIPDPSSSSSSTLNRRKFSSMPMQKVSLATWGLRRFTPKKKKIKQTYCDGTGKTAVIRCWGIRPLRQSSRRTWRAHVAEWQPSD